MPTVDRRRFLQLAGGSAAAASLSALTPSIARAASLPANRRHGSIEDVEHVVVLMQENRSFDHYFGTMRGVRGFGDPHPATQPAGPPVWNQSDGTRTVLPFRPDLKDLGLAFIQDLDHGWEGTHEAFNGGRYDRWIPAKTSTTMAHLVRHDMPFHFALADAFTVCDDYHCSLLGPTDPNRYYMWTGWVGNDGNGGGPVIANDELGYGWTTYPERLQRAGVSWQIYQDAGIGLDAAGVWGYTDDAYIGNYGDNSLLYFDQYRTARPGDALFDRARTGTDVSAGGTFFDRLAADVRNDRLPQVSYVVAPEAFTEHPNWPANYGAWYTARVIDALTSNPDVWAKTVLFLTFDENDGFFDHVVPAYPPVAGLAGASTVSTANELFEGIAGTSGGSNGTPGPYGLGVRVPMTVVSPWSTGGWVCSETYDHTSIIRFCETRFGVTEPNVTPWRRTVCGDLTAAFDFGRTRTRTPSLPSTAAYEPTDDERHPDYVPTPPANGRLPEQERGVRPSRALGYALTVTPHVTVAALSLELHNRGTLGAHLQARSTAEPQSYTLGAGHTLRADVPIAGAYDVQLHGPDGLYRRFAGTSTARDVEVTFDPTGAQPALQIANDGSRTVHVALRNAYAHGRVATVRVAAGRTERVAVPVRDTGGWYDIIATLREDSTFVRTIAGRVHDGRAGISDPQLSG